MSSRKAVPSAPPPIHRATPLPLPLQCAFSPKELLGWFRKLLPAQLVEDWLAQTSQDFYQRAWTPLITLWYFLFQRLGPDPTLANALADAQSGGADCLSPPGKLLSRQIQSSATTALSDARQRLPVPVLEQALPYLAQQIRTGIQGLQWQGWTVLLLDGSTFALRPYQDITPQFSPHPNGKSSSPYWCLARVVAGFCLASGVVLDCVVENNTCSEQALATELLGRRSWPQTLVVGDRNLGVYAVARSAQEAQAQSLLRLTKARARKLARGAGLKLAAGLDAPVSWTPSARDQCPEQLARQPVAGRLIVARVSRRGFRPQTLYLFTTLTDPATYSVEALVQLYGQRWQVELNLRYVKVQLGLEHLECKSGDIARKEWLGGLLAYNLIRALMVAAAAQAHLPVSVLSFSRTRQLFLHWLLRWGNRPGRNLQRWEELLTRVASARQPKRRKRRPAEPRAVRHRKSIFPTLRGDRALARKKLKITKPKRKRTHRKS